MVSHVVSQVIVPTLVYATLRCGYTLLAASGLSFLGLGVQPPDRHLGQDARRRPQLCGNRLVALHVPWGVHHAAHARPYPDW